MILKQLIIFLYYFIYQTTLSTDIYTCNMSINNWHHDVILLWEKYVMFTINTVNNELLKVNHDLLSRFVNHDLLSRFVYFSDYIFNAYTFTKHCSHQQEWPSLTYCFLLYYLFTDVGPVDTTAYSDPSNYIRESGKTQCRFSYK